MVGTIYYSIVSNDTTSLLTTSTLVYIIYTVHFVNWSLTVWTDVSDDLQMFETLLRVGGATYTSVWMCELETFVDEQLSSSLSSSLTLISLSSISHSPESPEHDTAVDA